MWSQLEEIWSRLTGICFGGFLLWHFSMIARYGTIEIQENCPVILWAEIVIVGLFVLLGIKRLLIDLIRMRRLP